MVPATDHEEIKRQKRNDATRKWALANPDKRREISQRYKKNNPEKTAEYSRKYNQANRESRRLDSEMRNWRAGGYPEPTRPRPEGCEVCGGNSGAGKLHLDHDHATGKFRGWLCSRCNMALGYSKDSPERLKLMIDYLERNQ